jgi:hypothetical protein
MSRTPTPRQAQLTHVSPNPHQPVLVGRITAGPAPEVGKLVHLRIHKTDIETIREFLDKLEAAER